MQFLHRGGGLHPDLPDQGAPQLPERLQRLGLAACLVQGEHQLLVQRLPQRVRLDQRPQLRDQFTVSAQAQIRLDASLQRQQSGLVEPLELGLDVRAQRQVGARFAAPEQECAGQCLGGARGVAPQQQAAAAPAGVGEDPRVEFALAHLDQVARGHRADPRPGLGAELAAQPRDVVAQSRRRHGRLRVPPQLFSQLSPGHHRVRVQQQEQQQVARDARPQHDRTRRRGVDGQRAEHVEPHAVVPLGSVGRRPADYDDPMHGPGDGHGVPQRETNRRTNEVAPAPPGGDGGATRPVRARRVSAGRPVAVGEPLPVAQALVRRRRLDISLLQWGADANRTGSEQPLPAGTRGGPDDLRSCTLKPTAMTTARPPRAWPP